MNCKYDSIPPPQIRRPAVLITAGPTHEPIDAVRFIGNRSSGTLGLCLAEAANALELQTTLLLGPVGPFANIDYPHVTVRRFQTTGDLTHLLTEQWPNHDILIMAAAVADFRPVDPVAGKLRRSGKPLVLTLEPTPDLLAHLTSRTRPDQLTIGFALEPRDRLMESAEAKLEQKGVDIIVANSLETMDADTITALILLRDGDPLSPSPSNTALTKPAFAAWLIDFALAQWRDRAVTK